MKSKEAFADEIRAELKTYEGKGLDDEKLRQLGERALANMNLTAPYAQKVGAQKIAAGLVILHAKELATK